MDYLHQNVGILFLTVCSRYYLHQNLSILTTCSRYVRLGSDCLGPRGDDKSGCRDYWETYCVMVESESRVTSYRANRFNNLFQAAAALHFHRADIKNFLEKYLAKQNRKIQSICADNKCDQVDCHVTALGLLYFRVTGPYWELLAQDIHYLDFCIYVNQLLQHFQRWAANPADAFSQEFDPLFGKRFMPDPDTFQALLSISVDQQAKVMATLRKISKEVIITINNQLKDFLEGGRYYHVTDPELRQRMKHCKLTNLVGEQAFGDLDFSIFKRRYASLHHHSTVQMMKQNKPISMWFSSKDEEEQKCLLNLSAEKAPLLRQQHVLEEKDCVARRRIVLEQNHLKKEAVRVKKSNKINEIIALMQRHRGPCQKAADVNRLLFTYKKWTDQIVALKAELQYHKIVLSSKSPLLQVGGKVQELVARLKSFLADRAVKTPPEAANTPPEAANTPPEAVNIPAAAANASLPAGRGRKRFLQCTANPAGQARKRQRLPSPSFPEDAQERHQSPSPPQPSSSVSSSFKKYSFSVQSEFVAVHYDNDYYIGEVVDVLSSEEGVVNFMERCTIKSTAFAWPKVPDRCTVHRNFVFANGNDISLAPISSSGRTWRVQDMTVLLMKYTHFRALFVDN